LIRAGDAPAISAPKNAMIVPWRPVAAWWKFCARLANTHTTIEISTRGGQGPSLTPPAAHLKALAEPAPQVASDRSQHGRLVLDGHDDGPAPTRSLSGCLLRCEG
jgi:hypothetical protein